MAELFNGTVEVERRRIIAGDSGESVRSCYREVPDFNSWLQCMFICSSSLHKVIPKTPWRCGPIRLLCWQNTGSVAVGAGCCMTQHFARRSQL